MPRHNRLRCFKSIPVFNINEFPGVKVPFTDKFLEDDFLAPAAIAALPRKMKRAHDEYFETQVLKLQRVQTANDANTINTAQHRFVAGGDAASTIAEPDDTMTLEDFAYARYALQKAKAPLTNLVAVVDPSFEFNTNLTATLVDVSFNPRWEGIIETGMGAGDSIRFIRNTLLTFILTGEFIVLETLYISRVFFERKSRDNG